MERRYGTILSVLLRLTVLISFVSSESTSEHHEFSYECKQTTENQCLQQAPTINTQRRFTTAEEDREARDTTDFDQKPPSQEEMSPNMTFLGNTDKQDKDLIHDDRTASGYNFNGIKIYMPPISPDIKYSVSGTNPLPFGGKETSMRQIRRMPRKPNDPETVKMHIPASFDAREKWPKCKSIGDIRNQGSCNSCWAHAVASALSDRLCIFSENNDFHPTLSAQDLLSCCSFCGTCGKGCEAGAVAEMAYDYFVTKGIVTGGGYSGNGCFPYRAPPISYSQGMLESPHAVIQCPESEKYCPNHQHPQKQFKADKLMGKAWYIVNKFNTNGKVRIPDTIRNMKLEIMLYGPVTVTIEMYKDLKEGYRSGVYRTPRDTLLGYHILKCIGWGQDERTGEDYWTLVNSWGSDWGENGTMRIRQGKNIAGVEMRVSAGIPARYRVTNSTSPTGGRSSDLQLAEETIDSKNQPYLGIDELWRKKLYKYENDCEASIYLGGGNPNDQYSNSQYR